MTDTGYRQSHRSQGRGQLYDARYGEGADAFYWQNFERPLINHILKRLADEGAKSYLDVATGTGRIIQLASAFFHSLTGIDISKPMLACAQEKVPEAQFIHTDVTQSDAATEQYDVITLFRFLLNAEATLRDDMLAWVASAMHADSYLLINNHGNAISLHGLARTLIRPFRKKQTLPFLSEQTLIELLRRHGLEIIETHGFNFFPAYNGKGIMPKSLLLAVESALNKHEWAQRVSSNRLYLCRLIRPNEST